MGAINFTEEAFSTSAEAAFNSLVEDAVYRNGHDSYNGTISTCVLRRVRKMADKYSKTVEKKAHDLIMKEDYGIKWEAECLDLGVVHYEIVKVKKVTKKISKPAEYGCDRHRRPLQPPDQR